MQKNIRKEYIDHINAQLGWLVANVKLNTCANRNDLSVDTENTVCGLLNRVCGWNLANANVVEKPNYPAVDLIDKDAGIAVQVTAQNKARKVGEMLEQFEKHNMKLEFYRLIMVVIGMEPPTQDMKKQEAVRFCGQTDIWNFNTLTRRISGMSVDKLKQIAEYLDEELGAPYAKPGGKAPCDHRLSEKDMELRNTLMKNGFTDEEAEQQKSAFNTGVKRCEVATIYFRDSLAFVPENAADASQIQSGAVKAWAVPNGGLYDLYIAAEGKIYAPDDSSNLFREMINLKKIDFNDAFSTKNASDMRSMFHNCRKLKRLDIGFFETGQVTDMAGMFCNCSSLSKLDVSGFDTSCVQDMHSMFFNCYGLTELKLGKMRTDQVKDMYGMFYRCSGLTELDVSTFDISNVTIVKNMFNGCVKLKNLDISGWYLSKVTLYENFMPAGMTVNGRPWEELFS